VDYHSLWFDEVISVFWAKQPIVRLWQVGMLLVEDKHPPLYQLLLHGWMSLFGSSDVALRSMGSMLGALAVFPALGIGRCLGNRHAGNLAALLVACSPILVWYSQEVRMFMPSTTIGLYGLYGLLRWWEACQSPPASAQRETEDPCRAKLLKWGWLLLALVGLVGSVYSYLFGVFFLAVAGVWVGALFLLRLPAVRQQGLWRCLLAAVAMMALVGVLVLPLMLSAWGVSGVESTPGSAFAEFGGTLKRLLRAYTIYKGPWNGGAVLAAQILAAALLLLGLLAPLRRDPDRTPLRWAGRPLLALYLIVPLLLGGILQSRNQAVFAQVHYFLILVPALCLLWGRGLSVLLERAKWLGIVYLMAMLALLCVGDSHLWLPENRREDWREAGEYVQAHAGPNDAVVTHVDYTHFAFEHYFDGPQPVYFPFTDHVTSPAQVEPPLMGLLGYDSVWLVQSHTHQFDPNHYVERWFADRFPLATEQYPSGVTVKRYITRYRLTEPPPHVPRVDSMLSPGIVLEACTVDDPQTVAREERSHPPSAWVHVQLYWSAPAGVEMDYASSVRMVDGGGQVWGEKLDRERGTLHLWPTSRWEPAEVIREDIDVNLNPITPPGAYKIVVSLTDREGQQAGPEVICGEVHVENG